MKTRKAQQTLISILMESPLYLTLPITARHSLIARLQESYPVLLSAQGSDKTEETPVGYESSWLGIF
ncbi:MAG: hypothetical protein HY755_09050 [Nitrospirae bacterium]|nr:hypothetical protein [Nitrospirota bacterium]